MKNSKRSRRELRPLIRLTRLLTGVVLSMAVVLAGGLGFSGETLPLVAVGTIVSKYSSPAPNSMYTNAFRVECEQCRYFIDVIGGWPGQPPLRSQDCYFDGENTYRFERLDPDYETSHLEVMDGNRLITKTLPNPVKVNIKANATIWSGPVPPPSNDPTFAALWLAFASQCYYSESPDSNQRPLFFISPKFESEQRKLKTTWSLENGHIREWKDFMTKDALPVLRASRPDTPEFEYCNSEFNVLESTNIQGTMLPTHFILRKFIYEGGVLRTNIIGEAFATELRFVDHVSHLVLRPATNLFVADARKGIGVGSQAYYYSAREGKLLTQSAIKNSLDYRIFAREIGRAGQRAHIGYWFYFLFIAALAAPFLIPVAKAMGIVKRK